MASPARNWVSTSKATLELLISRASSLFGKLIRSSESADYAAWRQQFLRERSRLFLLITFFCFLTFALHFFYAVTFSIPEIQKIPGELKTLLLLTTCATVVLLLASLIWQKTWGYRHPEIMFLVVSWSITLVPQIIGTLKGSPLPDITAWFFVFMAQATLIPVGWRLHLISQLGTIGYFAIVNSVLGLTTIMDQPIYTVLIFLVLFWYCFICDLGVYLYERLQRAEFASRRELRVFLHSVSHDLKTPVMGTSIVLQNLLNKSSDGKVTVSNSVIERLLQGSDRQLKLINALLEAHDSEVRGIPLHCEPLQLSTLVEVVLSDLEPVLTNNRVILKNQVSTDLPLVNADSTQLWRVFSNLITNALKHNPPGITLTLNAEVVEEELKQRRTGKINPKSKIEWIRCSVQDNGVGIPPEQCDRIFELYSRGARARYMPGLGLGLYLCQQIIKSHGGHIGVISTPGEGSTFWFTLLPDFQTKNTNNKD